MIRPYIGRNVGRVTFKMGVVVKIIQIINIHLKKKFLKDIFEILLNHLKCSKPMIQIVQNRRKIILVQSSVVGSMLQESTGIVVESLIEWLRD